MHGTIKNRNRFLNRYTSGAIYFRFNGKNIGLLPGEENSAEWNKAWDVFHARAMRGEFGKPNKRGRPAQLLQPNAPQDVRNLKPPAIGFYLTEWLRSDFFAPITKQHPKETPYAAGTQDNYRAAVDLTRTFALNAKGETLAGMPLHHLTPKVSRKFIQKVKDMHGGSTAALQKTILSKLWQFAVKRDDFDEGDLRNPMRDGEVENPYRVRQEHRDWPRHVIEAFLKHCDENLYLAFYLLLCTGQRVGDVVKLRWDQIRKEAGLWYLVLTQQKTGEEMYLRLPKRLVAILQKREQVDDHILTHSLQSPYTRDSLGHRIKDVLRIVAPNGKKTAGGLSCSDYTTHGLRKNAGIMLALNGASVQVIMACLGHRTEKMALYYIRLANKKKLAEQGADIMDAVFDFEDRERTAAARAKIRRVK